jgi:NADPH:quinone reductase
MKAAWYEKQGAAQDVLVVGEMDDPQPRAGEVRIRISFSGVNPGDVKKREDAFRVGMPYPRVIPHSDGSGTVDAVGDGVSRDWVGRRVWCYGAQSYRAFGTAAEYTVVPLKLVVQLPENCRWNKVPVWAFPASPHVARVDRQNRVPGSESVPVTALAAE